MTITTNTPHNLTITIMCETKHNVPIYTLDGKGDGMSYGRNANIIDWGSWDIFIKHLIVSNLMVTKDACLYPRRLRYDRGFLVLKSIISRKVICVKGIKSCNRIGLGVVLFTEEYGIVCFNFQKEEHVMAFSEVISGFISGLYSITLD